MPAVHGRGVQGADTGSCNGEEDRRGAQAQCLRPSRRGEGAEGYAAGAALPDQGGAGVGGQGEVQQGYERPLAPAGAVRAERLGDVRLRPRGKSA